MITGLLHLLQALAERAVVHRMLVHDLRPASYYYHYY